MQAHPRSRGENLHEALEVLNTRGSSPLTRGKRSSTRRSASLQRLIPAHAGKTPDSWRFRARATAHPRSRGENSRLLPPILGGRGSSPLTRGKHMSASESGDKRGLIPAHAGKTKRNELC